MTQEDLLRWTPRILGIALSLFLALFALDAFEPHKPLPTVLTGVAIHLVPAALVLAIVALAWHHPMFGGVAFVLLAFAYALAVRFRIDWVIAISGPLLVVGLLFLASSRTGSQRGQQLYPPPRRTAG